jgi:hypothetical protein
MNEQEWLTCTDPKPMLAFLVGRGRVSRRKLRLFAVASCRSIWRMLTDVRSRHAVEVAEQYADGKATLDELKAAGDAAIAATWAVQDELDAAWPAEPTCGVLQAAEAAEMSACPLPDGGVWGADGKYSAWEAAVEAAACGVAAEVQEQQQGHQAVLLRCIFGNPFRPVTLNPAWLTWHDGTIRKLAQAIYHDRAFDRLPVLADALEDAGCTDGNVLDHCRRTVPHGRGCWVVDLILGRE